MRFIAVLVLSLVSSAAFASEVKVPRLKMECRGSASYLPIKFKIVVDTLRGVTGNRGQMIAPTGATVVNDNIILDYSESECEDSTSLTFDEAQFRKFSAGKEDRLFGKMVQEEPEFKLETDIYCDRVR